MGHVPDSGGQHRVGLEAIQDPVTVGPASRRKSGVELFLDPLQGRQHYRRADTAVDDPPQDLEFLIRPLRQIEAHHLADGVDAPIGPTGTCEGDLRAEDVFKHPD